MENSKVGLKFLNQVLDEAQAPQRIAIHQLFLHLSAKTLLDNHSLSHSVFLLPHRFLWQMKGAGQ
jgi:hypothetical protein